MKRFCVFFFGVDVVGKVADIIVHVHRCRQVHSVVCFPFVFAIVLSSVHN